MVDIKVEKEYVLLVEGEDEKKFFCSYLKHLGIEDVQTIPVGGKDKFKKYFLQILKILFHSSLLQPTSHQFLF